MDAKQFFRETEKLRKLQKEYFKTKSYLVLEACKKQEKLIDEEIRWVNSIIEKKKQPDLFDY